MHMNRTASFPALPLLEEAIVAAFSRFDTGTLEGAVSSALVGEYFGVSTFRALAADTTGVAEKRFWELSANMEALTLTHVEHFCRRREIPLPAKKPYFQLGVRTAEVFSGEPHHDYCAWVATLIDDALRDFEALRLRCRSPEEVAVGNELVDHEAAIAAAWKLLPQGFDTAGRPLVAHLKRYG